MRFSRWTSLLPAGRPRKMLSGRSADLIKLRLPNLPALWLWTKFEDFPVGCALVIGQRRLSFLLPHFFHAVELRQHFGSFQLLGFRIVVIKPWISRSAVLTNRERLGWRLLSGNLLPSNRINQMHKTSAPVLRVPIVDRIRIAKDFLPHTASRSKSHRILTFPRDPDGVVIHLCIGTGSGSQMLNHWKTLLENIALHWKDFDLDSPKLRFPGDLLFDRIISSQGHRDELPNHPLLDAIAIKPGLVRNDQIALRITAQAPVPFVSRDRVDFPGRNFDCEGIFRRVLFHMPASKMQPKRLALPHRQEHPAAFQPGPRCPFRII